MDSTISSPQEPTRGVPLPEPVSSPLPAAGEQCATCAAPLAPDQRYCVECGERRGDPRLPVMTGRPPLTPDAPPAVRGTGRGPRASAGTTLIAGVGTLLLALGVGVLIGRSGDTSSPGKSAGVQVVTVAGAGGAVAPTGSSATPASTAGAAAAGGAAAAKGAKAKSDAKAKANADAKAPKSGAVTPSKGKVVKLGSKGSGKGYKNGKFTGDFFGP